MRCLILFLLVFYLKLEINIEEFYKIRDRSNKIAQNINKTKNNKLNFNVEEIIPFDLEKNINNKNNIDIKVFQNGDTLGITSYFKFENKKFEVLIDTGYFDLFFFSKKSNETTKYGKFECGNNFCTCTNKDGHLKYGIFIVYGKICSLYDNIFNKNISYNFLLGNRTFSIGLDFDGLLGLGPSKTKRLNKKSFPEIFDKTHFVIDLPSKKITLSNNCNFHYKGEYTTLPSIDKNFYSANVIIKLGNKSLNSKFIFDSSTRLTVLPKKFISFLEIYFNSNNIDYKFLNGWFRLTNINKLTKIDFQIGKYLYSLDPSEYYFGEKGNYMLNFHFSKNEFGILGLNFLINNTICHDIVNNTSTFLIKINSSKSYLLYIILGVILLIIIIIIVIIVLIKKKKKNDSLLN